MVFWWETKEMANCIYPVIPTAQLVLDQRLAMYICDNSCIYTNPISGAMTCYLPLLSKIYLKIHNPNSKICQA